MKSIILKTLIVFAIIAGIQSCKKDDDTTSADKELYSAISNTSGYSFYVGTPGITSAAGNSPHGFERVRFNSIAQAALDSTGKLPVGGSFPTGSIIVKDVYSSASGSINLYAVMKKDPGNSSAANGYLWAEYKTDGTAAFSITKKGSGCISCHSGSPTRDMVKSFDLH